MNATREHYIKLLCFNTVNLSLFLIQKGSKHQLQTSVAQKKMFVHRPAKNNPPVSEVYVEDFYWLDNSFSFVPIPMLHIKHHVITKVYFFMLMDIMMMIEESPSLSAIILWVQLTSTFPWPHPWGDMDDQGIQLTYCITRLDGRAVRRVRERRGDANRRGVRRTGQEWGRHRN